MKRYISKFEEYRSDPDRDLILYHGSKSRLNLRPGILFTTDDEENASKFGLQMHNFGDQVSNAYLYILGIKASKTYNASSIIDDFIMEVNNDIFGDFDGYSDLDKWIFESFAPWLRKKGFRLFTFNHPSFGGGKDIQVTVSLYPDRDIEILEEISI